MTTAQGRHMRCSLVSSHLLAFPLFYLSHCLCSRRRIISYSTAIWFLSLSTSRHLSIQYKLAVHISGALHDSRTMGRSCIHLAGCGLMGVSPRTSCYCIPMCPSYREACVRICYYESIVGTTVNVTAGCIQHRTARVYSYVFEATVTRASRRCCRSTSFILLRHAGPRLALASGGTGFDMGPMRSAGQTMKLSFESTRPCGTGPKRLLSSE